MIHCLFEQSGTFKNEFIKLGYDAKDYDIQNEFNETDVVCDLFDEIEKAYCYRDSIFDGIRGGEYIMSFFPCTRFEEQIQMHFRGTAYQMKSWSDMQKLEYVMQLHKELHDNYQIICMMVIVCIRKDIKLVIENPYSSMHYLTKYFPIKSAFVDKNRWESGDYYEKPTQYWFVNCEPKNNLIFEPILYKPKKIIDRTNSGIERSMISKDYANRFIREYIIDEREETK